MFRQIRRRLHHRLNGRARAALLLFVWVFCVVLTVVHDDGDASAAAQTSSHATATATPASGGSRAVALRSPSPQVVASCDANGPCHDPSHHHRPLGHHDVTQCPYCALMLERPADLPVFSFAPPTTVRFVVAPVVLRLSESQRCACALARGPPPPPSECAPV